MTRYRGGTALASGVASRTLTFEECGAGRDRLLGIQRARLTRAMCELCSERGVDGLVVGDVVERAGVSRRTFYEIFRDREECFVAALEEAAERAGEIATVGYEAGNSWAERIRRALEAVLRFADEDPAAGRTLFIESLGAGVRAREIRSGIVNRLVDIVDAGRHAGDNGSPATRLTAEGVVGGVASVIHDRLVSGDPALLTDLLNDFMSMIVLPYLGPDAAREELQRLSASVVPRARSITATASLQRLEMRLTYRTVMVLSAIAANPGRSNKAVSAASGVTDQGQISKLLSRLEGFGLVENAGAGSPRGAKNAWILTEQGKEVHHVLFGDRAIGS
jgi:AcrR family transcriptional regulator